MYQVYYRLRRSIAPLRIPYESVQVEKRLKLQTGIPADTSFIDENTFSFLNLAKKFDTEIDWNFSGYGKLWCYNLNYFDFLNQENIDTTRAVGLLESYWQNREALKDGIEPYPISLRGINTIKFISRTGLTDSRFDALLFQHYRILASSLEYHLLGNHLLENGFSLLYGAYFFQNELIYTKAKAILETELNEQLTNDGAHFELSPMYHQIILFRLLDCINLLNNNQWKKDTLREFLIATASRMLGWLNRVTFENGDIPMVNDASPGIAPNTKQLRSYARALGIASVDVALTDSGYRMIGFGDAELFVDVGKIGPDYIPGHAHSDTLNFLLHLKKNPFIVEAGTSTYDTGPQRLLERSTKSHNTVVINDLEQSEVWASFRVGTRAKIVSFTESATSITAAHDGYLKIGTIHSRRWEWGRGLRVTDTLVSQRSLNAIAFFHFDHTIQIEQVGLEIKADDVKIEFNGALSVEVVDYQQALGFNRRVLSKMLKVKFEKELITTLVFENTLL